jgi:hypothetical protein
MRAARVGAPISGCEVPGGRYDGFRMSGPIPPLRAIRLLPLTGALAAGCCCGARADVLSQVRTVFVIVMENQDWSAIRGNTNAPYLNTVLLPLASHGEQYYNPPGMHPSLTDYLWLEAGTNFGILNNDSPFTNACQTVANCQTTTNHLVSYLNRAGISWKGYFEDCPTNVIELAGYNFYAVRHNPFAYFFDVIGPAHDAVTCTGNYPYGVQHLRPYTELAADLASNTVAQYNFIVPNLCNDMHNSCPPLNNPILQGDTWLAAEVPRVLNSAAWQSNGVLFLLWEEANTGDGPIGMLVLSPLARGGGYFNTVHYTHSSLLRTVQEIFGVMPFLGDAANAVDLADLFNEFRISDPVPGAGGAMQLTVSGATPGATNVVLASSNLASWFPISTNVAASASFTVSDGGASGEGKRYYRVVRLGP